jgi:type VI secretion system secreted protein VgrG
MTRPDLVIGSVAGIATTAADSTHMASQNDHAITTGRDVSLSVGRSLMASVFNGISLFAAHGAKLFAGSGKVEIQAHTDNIEVAAQKTVKLTSSQQNVEAMAKGKILLGSGGKAYIDIDGDNINICAPGKVTIKCADFAITGPASLSDPLPDLPSGDACSEQFIVHDKHTGKPVPYIRYRVESDNGQVFEGTTDENGLTPPIITANPQALKIYLDD